MKYALQFKALASHEINDVYAWYESKKEKLGEQFLAELANKIEKIQAHPTWFTKRAPDYYSVFMNRFPYEIIYRLQKNTIVVIAVYSAKRDPTKKLRR